MDFIVDFLNISLQYELKDASDYINIDSDIHYYNAGVYQDFSEPFITLILAWIPVYLWLH